MKNQNFQLMTDAELVAEFKQGNESAYNALYYKYKTSLHNFMYRLTQNVELAEDITQTTFIKMFEKIDLYSENSVFKSWLFTIAKNHFINMYRKEMRWKLIISEDEFVNLYHSSLVDKDSIEKMLESKEKTAELMSKIERLPKNQKLVISFLLKGLKYKEIAELFNMNLNNVKTFRRLGVENLRNIYNVHVPN